MIKRAYVAVTDFFMAVFLVCFFSIAEALGGMDSRLDDDYWPPLVLVLAMVLTPAAFAIWG